MNIFLDLNIIIPFVLRFPVQPIKKTGSWKEVTQEKVVLVIMKEKQMRNCWNVDLITISAKGNTDLYHQRLLNNPRGAFIILLFSHSHLNWW